MIKIENTFIDGCKIIECDRYFDSRGQFQELFEEDKYQITSVKWRQVNWSISNKNVLRGIHLAEYAKLVTCVSGKIWDFVVDFRKDSKTFLQHIGIELSAEESKQVLVPEGCGHGFVALEDKSSVVYLQTSTFAKSGEKTILYSDPKLNINYPGNNWIISERDLKAMTLEQFLD